MMGSMQGLRLLELLKNSPSLDQRLPQHSFERTNEIRIPLSKHKIEKLLQNLKRALDEKKEPYSQIDGIRVSRSDSWFLVRKSQTEFALVLRMEGRYQDKNV